MTIATVKLLDDSDVVVAQADTSDFWVQTDHDGTWSVRLIADVAVAPDREATQVQVCREDGEIQSWSRLDVPAVGGVAGAVVAVNVALHMSVAASMFRRAGIEP